MDENLTPELERYIQLEKLLPMTLPADNLMQYIDRFSSLAVNWLANISNPDFLIAHHLQRHAAISVAKMETSWCLHRWLTGGCTVTLRVCPCMQTGASATGSRTTQTILTHAEVVCR